jgi:type IV secretion system protein VirB2
MKAQTNPRKAQTGVVGFFLAVLCSPAFAQLSKSTSFLASVAGWMQSIGATVITIAVMWAGFQMVFGHKKLTDLGNLFWGSFLIGGAGLVAGWLYSGTAN